MTSMIESVLNKVIDLETSDGIILNGYFVKPGNNIWYIARVEFSNGVVLSKKETISLTGSIGNTYIYIEAAHITSRSANGYKPEFMEIKVFPFEIVLHHGKIEKNLTVNSLLLSFSELNWFFNNNILPLNESTISGNNTILSQEPFDFNSFRYNGISKMSVFKVNNIYSSKNTIKVVPINNILLEFGEPKTQGEVIRELSIFKMLFTFLADHYVDFPKEVKFSTSNSDVFTGYSGEAVTLQDYTLWLNENRYQSPMCIDRPFRIYYDKIVDEFEDIVIKWGTFREQQKNHPIIELFSSIIKDKSKGLNRFLNLCQALEVYSNQYRNEECTKILKEEKEVGKTTNKKITLRIRLIDFFKKYSEILDLTYKDISIKGEHIAIIRNYYTHYSEARRLELEGLFPDCQEYYSIFDGLLYNLLLTVIYTELGIPVDIIKESLPDPTTRFGVSPEEILEGPK